jgi:UDP-GlcNAc:undecaprenyl-phosphate GlcNAc-1-phosphate transferase
MFLAFLIAVAVALPYAPLNGPDDPARVLGILLGCAIVAVVGAIDDRWELDPLPQFVAQTVAAMVAIGAGVVVHVVTNPFGERGFDTLVEVPLYVAFPFTLLWIVGAINAVNFLDGLDGLAAGIGGIAALILTVHNLLFPSPLLGSAVLPAALAGACFGFLFFNFYPARITMGTCGAAFLGFALGTLSIMGVIKAATLLLVLGIPILDTAWIILQRLARGQSPFHGDRRHLHYRLADLGLSQRQIVGLLYALSALPGLLAIFLPTPLLKLYAIGALVLVMALASLGVTLADLRSDRGR